MGPAGRAAHALLSLRAWAVLEPLSYSAYLYHEQVRIRTLRRWPVFLARFHLFQTGLTSRLISRVFHHAICAAADSPLLAAALSCNQ